MGAGDVFALVIEQCLALCTARCSPCLRGPSRTVGKQSLDTRVLKTRAQDYVHAVPELQAEALQSPQNRSSTTAPQTTGVTRDC